MRAIIFAVASLAALVAAHGNVASPSARTVGNAMVSTCGSVVSGILKSDINTNQQQLEQVCHRCDL